MLWKLWHQRTSKLCFFSAGPNSHFERRVTAIDISWIGSLLCLGGFFGTILFGKISQHFGKKVSLLLLAMPNLSFWIIVLLSTKIQHLYAARFLAGITGGGMLRTISLYVSEISENKIRGRLGSYLILFLSTGTLLSFIAGAYLSFFVVPWVMMIFPVWFFVSVSFLPDTPSSLLSRNMPRQALNSLTFYRSYESKLRDGNWDINNCNEKIEELGELNSRFERFLT